MKYASAHSSATKIAYESDLISLRTAMTASTSARIVNGKAIMVMMNWNKAESAEYQMSVSLLN